MSTINEAAVLRFSLDTQDISLPIFSTQTDGLVPKRVGATADKYLREDGTWVVPPDTTYALLTQDSAENGTATTANTISAQVLKEAIQYHAPTVTNIVGNAGTATKLETPRTINGVSFDGTADVTTSTWGTPRTLTIGRTGKSVDGSTNVAWTADEILPTGISGKVLKHNGTSWVAGDDDNTLYSAMSATEANTGTAMSVRVITAAVLKGAIQTHAPVSGCRAWLSVNAVTSTILQSFNIASVVKTATGQFEITFTTPMPHQNYVAFTNSITVKGGAATDNTVGSTFNATQTNTVSRCYIWCWSTTTGALINPEVLNVGVFC